MSRASNEEQFKFLISCIRYSNNGKVDFGQVAQECNIISKGAAAKRYERMMKIHGIHETATTRKSATTQNRVPKTERRESAPSKKRKGEAYLEANTTADDDEEFPSIKKDPVQVKEEYKVKEESNTEDKTKGIFDFNAGLLKYMDSSADLDSIYNNFSTEPSYHFASTGAESSSSPYGFDSGSGSGSQNNNSFMSPFAPSSESFGNPYSPVPTSMGMGASAGMGAGGIPYQQQLQYSTQNNQSGSQRVSEQQRLQFSSSAPRGSNQNSIVLD